MSLSPTPSTFFQTAYQSNDNPTYLIYKNPWGNNECWEILDTFRDSSSGFYAVLGEAVRGIIRGAHQLVRIQVAQKLEEYCNHSGFINPTLQSLYKNSTNSLNIDSFLKRLINIKYFLNRFEVQMLGEIHDLRVEIISEYVSGECYCENEKFLPPRNEDTRELIVVHTDGEHFSRCQKS